MVDKSDDYWSVSLSDNQKILKLYDHQYMYIKYDIKAKLYDML